MLVADFPQILNRSIRDFANSFISEDDRDRAITYSYGMDERPSYVRGEGVYHSFALGSSIFFVLVFLFFFFTPGFPVCDIAITISLTISIAEAAVHEVSSKESHTKRKSRKRVTTINTSNARSVIDVLQLCIKELGWKNVRTCRLN